MKNLLLMALLLLASAGCRPAIVYLCEDDIEEVLEEVEIVVLGCVHEGEEDIITYDEVLPPEILYVGGPLYRRAKTVWVLDTGVSNVGDEFNLNTDLSTSFVPDQTDHIDEHGHGTHVAGTIAAKVNDVGVIGVTPGNEVVAVKVLTKGGSGRWSWAAQAVYYVIANGTPGDVVNMSFGGRPSSASEELESAILDAANLGFIFSIAAGNSGGPVENFSPARVVHENVYTVSAVAHGCRASFSNFGETVAYAAPGYKVKSASLSGGFSVMSGTSMAAPHVAGLLLHGEPQSGWPLECDREGERLEDGEDLARF